MRQQRSTRALGLPQLAEPLVRHRGQQVPVGMVAKTDGALRVRLEQMLQLTRVCAEAVDVAVLPLG